MIYQLGILMAEMAQVEIQCWSRSWLAQTTKVLNHCKSMRVSTPKIKNESSGEEKVNTSSFDSSSIESSRSLNESRVSVLRLVNLLNQLRKTLNKYSYIIAYDNKKSKHGMYVDLFSNIIFESCNTKSFHFY